ncbi:MAG TPA: ABC transporter substrate-binding protein [Thermoanaerobaculia bacterium]|jgi:ABC-type branched-subunit amino acid transport system substrate-binding protein|nr:ABC transporter substrate-binding protein [Thermoanaerobaculia bacterium]
MKFFGGGRCHAALVPAIFSVLFLLVLRPASPEDSKPQLERGRQIYLEGTSPSGSEITAVMSDAGVEVPASAVPCAGCHGRDGKGNPEGGISPSDLTWTALTRPYGVIHPGGRKHPPYDAKLLKRAIALGIDPAGTVLHVAMPRFRMNLKDMDDLLAYLRQLGTGTDPGVSETAVRIGVVLPPAGGPLSGLGKAVRAALTARFEAVNKDGGIYGRRIEPRFFDGGAPADQRRAWTSDFLQREEVFAGLSPFFSGAETEMALLFQEKQVPVVGPFTLHPSEAFPLNRYVFYLLPGIEAQEKALTVFAQSAGWPPPRTLAAGPVTPVEVSRLAAEKADTLIFPGSGAEAVALLQTADRLGWHPRLLVTGAAADNALFGAPAAFDGRIFVALPSPPGGPGGETATAYRSLGPLPADNLSAQWAALGAAEVLIEGMKRAGRDLSREKLVDQLESLRGFATGYSPPVTYGPARRLGARGAYVMKLDLRAKSFIPQGGWVEAE